MGSPGSCGTQPRCNAEPIKGCARKLTTRFLSFVAPTICGNGDSSRRLQERRLGFFHSDNVPKRTTTTRRRDSATSRSQQHGISGRPAATQNTQRDDQKSHRKQLWQITPTIGRLWRLVIHVIAGRPQLGCMVMLARTVANDASSFFLTPYASLPLWRSFYRKDS